MKTTTKHTEIALIVGDTEIPAFLNRGVVLPRFTGDSGRLLTHEGISVIVS